MARFIQLTRVSDSTSWPDIAWLLNIEQVVGVYNAQPEDGSWVQTTSGKVRVRESYNTVNAMITSRTR